MEYISVLMPAYNAAAFIREAVDSILKQSYTYFELIIVNDGSTDETETIINSFQDDRIRYYKNQTNKGLTYTRDRLLDLAQYPFIAFLDSDDIAFPDRFQLQMDFLKNNPDIGLVAGSLYAKTNGKIDKKSFVFDLNDKALPAHMLFYNPVSTSSILFKKEILPAVHFREDYPPVEDYDLWTRILYSNKGVVLKNILGYYRLHENSISKQRSIASYSNRNKVVLDQLEHYFKDEITEDDKALHLSLADYSFKRDPEDWKRIFGWVIKLVRLNERFQYFDNAALNQVLYERTLKKCLRLDRYNYSVFQMLKQAKQVLQPALTVELRKKELAVLAFSLARHKFIEI